METFELKQTLLKQRCLTCNQDFQVSDNLKSCPTDGTMLSPVFEDPFIGTVIDKKYEVTERIAAGTKAKIYKAWHLHLSKFIVLKVLQVGIALTQAQVARFQKEAQVAVRLIHPNIVRVYDYGTHPQPYIAMEYVDGTTLAVVIKESGPLLPERALPVFLDIANAMCTAHAAGLVHRDLKPSNVIIDSTSGQAKVLDFGLVKDFLDDANYTNTGDIVGSPSYMSPEQWKGQALDGRSDIYSLGCLMYETLTGTCPFAGSNTVESMFKHLETAPAKFGKVRQDLKFPPGLEALIDKCLAKNKEDRYLSMAELTGDLQSVQSGKGKGIKWHSRRNVIRFFAGSWLAVLLLFMLSGMALFYRDSRRPQWQKDFADGLAAQADRRDYKGSIPLLLKAEREAQAAHAHGAEEEEMYIYLGLGYFFTDQLEKARDHFKHALELNMMHEEDVPRSFCYEKLSDTYAKMKQYGSALEQGKSAVAVASRQSMNNVRLSDCYLCVATALSGLGRYAEALEPLQKARQLGEKQPTLEAHTRIPGFDETFNFLSALLRLGPRENQYDLLEIDTKLAEVYQKLHRDKDSFATYQDALRLACEVDPERLPGLATALLAGLKDGGAMEFISENAERQHWPPYLTSILKGELLDKQRDYSAALTEFDKALTALKEKPNVPGLRAWIYAWKGSVLESQKNFSEALIQFDKGLKLLQEGPSYLANWTELVCWIEQEKRHCQSKSSVKAVHEQSASLKLQQ